VFWGGFALGLPVGFVLGLLVGGFAVLLAVRTEAKVQRIINARPPDGR
jgi:hypothetical protein